MPLPPCPPRLYRSGTTDGDCSFNCQVGQIDRGLLWDFWQLGHRVCPFSPHTFSPGSCWPHAVPHLVPPCPLAAALAIGSHRASGAGVVAALLCSDGPVHLMSWGDPLVTQQPCRQDLAFPVCTMPFILQAPRSKVIPLCPSSPRGHQCCCHFSADVECQAW